MPAGPTEVQVRPPSTVRMTVPAYPLAQATDRETAASPRSREVVPVVVSDQDSAPAGPALSSRGGSEQDRRGRGEDAAGEPAPTGARTVNLEGHAGHGATAG